MAAEARIEQPGAVPGPGAAPGSEPGTGNTVSGTFAVADELDVMHVRGRTQLVEAGSRYVTHHLTFMARPSPLP